MSDQIAVFVDGDNISAHHAAQILNVSTTLGEPIIQRVYGDVGRMPLWQKQSEFSMVHSGTGKNATDLLIAVDAMEFALTRPVKKILIVSSDGDYRHLAFRLRELGLQVVGAGTKNAAGLFKSACTNFIELTCQKSASPCTTSNCKGAPPSRLEQQIRKAILTSSSNGNGIRITELNSIMRMKYDFKISDISEKTWRSYLCKRAHIFALDAPGKDAKVRAKVSNLDTTH